MHALMVPSTLLRSNRTGPVRSDPAIMDVFGALGLPHYSSSHKMALSTFFLGVLGSVTA